MASDTGELPKLQVERSEGTFLVETYDEVASVTVFNDKVIVISNGGSVMVIDRYNGQLRVA